MKTNKEIIQDSFLFINASVVEVEWILAEAAQRLEFAKKEIENIEANLEQIHEAHIDETNK